MGVAICKMMNPPRGTTVLLAIERRSRPGDALSLTCTFGCLRMPSVYICTFCTDSNAHSSLLISHI